MYVCKLFSHSGVYHTVVMFWTLGPFANRLLFSFSFFVSFLFWPLPHAVERAVSRLPVSGFSIFLFAIYLLSHHIVSYLFTYEGHFEMNRMMPLI